LKVVIDSNILFAALIRDSTVRKIILEHDGQFLFPEYIFEEMGKHIDEILEKSGQSRDDFNALLDVLLRKVEIVGNSRLLRYNREASELVDAIDPDDLPFVACTLANPGSILWSEDKRLKTIKEIKVMNTKEIVMSMSIFPKPGEWSG